MPLRDEIAAQARALSAADRAFLIDLLESSLEEDGLADARLDAAWTTEVSRRLDAYDRGESRAVGLTEAMATMRRRFTTPPGAPNR
jgi:putative addiction module component (TIGR02574 family)